MYCQYIATIEKTKKFIALNKLNFNCIKSRIGHPQKPFKRRDKMKDS